MSEHVTLMAPEPRRYRSLPFRLAVVALALLGGLGAAFVWVVWPLATLMVGAALAGIYLRRWVYR